MKIIRSKAFTGEQPWAALDIACMNGISTRLHWTDQPYHWHVNEGEEVFVVLDGRVEMRYRENGEEHRTLLRAGDVFFAGAGGLAGAAFFGVADLAGAVLAADFFAAGVAFWAGARFFAGAAFFGGR